jgi:hypothetical protein
VGVETDRGEGVDEGGGEWAERTAGQVLLHQGGQLEDLGLGLIGVAVIMVVARRGGAATVMGMTMAVVTITMRRLEWVRTVARG